MRKLAPRLKLHLDAMGIAYEVKRHDRTATSSETAEAAHVPGRRMAKAVLLKDAAGPLLAVLASTQHVELDLLSEALGRRLELASEAETARVFFDCAVGALPAAGAVYGVDVVVDSAFDVDDEVYVEAGDHEHVLRLSGEGFRRLTRLADRVDFAAFGPAGRNEPAAMPKATRPKTGRTEAVTSEADEIETATSKPAKPRKRTATKKASEGRDGAAPA